MDKLLLITQAKLNIMKLKLGLVAFHVIQPGDRLRLLHGPHKALVTPTQHKYIINNYQRKMKRDMMAKCD